MSKNNEQKAGIFLFTGEDSISLKKQMRHWKKQCAERYGETNADQVEVKSPKDILGIIPKITSYPFLGEKKMIFIMGLPPAAGKEEDEEESENRTGKEMDALLSALQLVPANNMIVFVAEKPDKRTRLYKELLKSAEIKEFGLLKGEKLTQWIVRSLEEERRVIDQEVAEKLKVYCGENMPHLQNELEKLTVSTNEGEKISWDHIQAVCSALDNQNIFQFTDEIGAKNPKRLLELLESLIRQGEAVQMIFYMMVRQLRLMIQTKYLLNKKLPIGMIQSRLALQQFQVSKLIKQVEGRELKNLISMHDVLFQIDLKVKTGRIPSSGEHSEILRLAIEREVVKFSTE